MVIVTGVLGSTSVRNLIEPYLATGMSAAARMSMNVTGPIRTLRRRQWRSAKVLWLGTQLWSHDIRSTRSLSARWTPPPQAASIVTTDRQHGRHGVEISAGSPPAAAPQRRPSGDR